MIDQTSCVIARVALRSSNQTIDDLIAVGGNSVLPYNCDALCTMTTPMRRARRSTTQTNMSPTLLSLLVGFAFGFVVCGTIMLSLKFEGPRSTPLVGRTSPLIEQNALIEPNSLNRQHQDLKEPEVERRETSSSESILNGVRILIAIAAFDFAQLPHFEEVIDAYSDLCAAGALVDVIVHATVPYPITLIDLLNTRLSCVNPAGRFDVKISLVSPSVRLHLVDIHRPLFYEKIEEYDLFIYTEDDIRVTPRTVAAYLHETKVLQDKVGFEKSLNYNVGIVRYEYNFPSNVLMDDNTRHATQNVTRVYWEHSYNFPAMPKVVDVVPGLDQEYVHMKNHHQGMFFATRDLLKAWKKRCQFDVVTDRPGRGSQPSEGTQVSNLHQRRAYTERPYTCFLTATTFCFSSEYGCRVSNSTHPSTVECNKSFRLITLAP